MLLNARRELSRTKSAFTATADKTKAQEESKGHRQIRIRITEELIPVLKHILGGIYHYGGGKGTGEESVSYH